MEIFSISTVSEELGTTTRQLRYVLDKAKPVPDRRFKCGKHPVRYFTAEDVELLKELWQERS